MGGMEALRLLEAGKLPGASAGLEQHVQSLASKLVVLQKSQEAKVIELERRLGAGERVAEVSWRLCNGIAKGVSCPVPFSSSAP